VICVEFKTDILKRSNFMSKGLAIFLAILAFFVSYIPAAVFYMRPQLTFGLAKVFNIPLYMLLGVSVFLIFALIAFYVRAYSVAVVIAFIPVIIFVIIGVIAGIAFLFYKDIMFAIMQERMQEMFTTPVQIAAKTGEKVVGGLRGLFGK